MSIDPQLVLTAGSLVAAGGVAWGMAKAGAANVRGEIRGLRADFKQHARDDHSVQLDNVERLSSLETLVKEIHREVVKRES